MKITKKSWGYYKVLNKSSHAILKELCIYPHSSTSLQLHNHREEIVVIEKGELTVKTSLVAGIEREFPFKEGEFFEVAENMKHQYINNTDSNVILTELWISQDGILDENDIERFN